MRRTFQWLTLGLLLGACQERSGPPQPLVSDLRFLPELPDSEGPGAKRIELDYTDALDGFTVPTVRQVPGGAFSFSFTARVPLRYKLYWRNSSYMFPERGPDGLQHPLAHENFYGSWEDPAEGFRPVAAPGPVTDVFRILGDPRKEPRFVERGKGHRASRNPRTGTYEFMLVVVREEDHDSIATPPEVMDISLTRDGKHTDPFWYYLAGPGSKDPRAHVLRPAETVRVVARPDLGTGIFVDRGDAPDGSAYRTDCGDAPALTASAPFKQFIHYVDESTRFRNVTVIADILGNAYTPADHDHYKAFFPREHMAELKPMTTERPCSTVRSDVAGRFIELRNPASIPGRWRKENVGVRSRHSLTYGRYRVKAELTRLLNDSDLWVGITNAIWLIYEGGPGQLRRPCAGGYKANYYGGDGDHRVDQVEYAEIDFEILKTVPYCPDISFPPTYPQPMAVPGDRSAWQRTMPEDLRAQRGMVAVACTNWDMACPEPSAFAAGCAPVRQGAREFLSHRWDHDYRAVTQKSMEPDKELFGSGPYWFEIDWRPEEIIWRIGPDTANLRTVGYMNSTMTNVPNVPMQLIVTQEYHNTKWWPGTPYDQGFIPFLAKDLVGRVYEVIIE